MHECKLPVPGTENSMSKEAMLRYAGVVVLEGTNCWVGTIQVKNTVNTKFAHEVEIRTQPECSVE